MTASDTDEATALIVGTDSRRGQLVREGFARWSVSATVVPDGRRALGLLADAAKGASETRVPRLVVVTLDIEPIDALTIIDAIRSSPRLGRVPVVALAGESGAPSTEQVYATGANAVVETPDTDRAYVDTIERLGAFWFEWASYSRESLYPGGSI